MNTIILNLIFYFIGISTIVPLSAVTARTSSKRSEFGEPCNKTLKCSGSAWLICVGGICACPRENEMIYDKSIKKCVSKAGERCRYEIDGSSEMNIFEKSDCVPNATCGSHGSCVCREEFYETSNGTCVEKGEYKDYCTSDLECRSDMSLKCLENVCQCDTTKSEFSREHNHCIGLGGHPCTNDKCTENAECKDGGICECSASIYRDDGTHVELFQDENGRCNHKKGRFEFCNSTDECNKIDAFLSCVDGKCDCETGATGYELIQGYNSYRHYEYWSECVGLAGKPCNPNRHCITNSDCNHDYNCHCREEYSITSTGRCGRNYGESCDTTEVCSDIFTCRGNACTCKTIDQSVYSSGKCLSIAYGPCQTDDDCIQTAECVKNRPDSGTGYCKCRKGFVENAQDSCELEFGTSCNNTGVPCDTLASLECLNGVCSCRDASMLYDEKNRQCLGLVGYICKRSNAQHTVTGNKYSCVQNAACHSVREELPGHCKCFEGFQETSKRTCVSKQNMSAAFLPDRSGSVAFLSSRSGAVFFPDRSGSIPFVPDHSSEGKEN